MSNIVLYYPWALAHIHHYLIHSLVDFFVSSFLLLRCVSTTIPQSGKYLTSSWMSMIIETICHLFLKPLAFEILHLNHPSQHHILLLVYAPKQPNLLDYIHNQQWARFGFGFLALKPNKTKPNHLFILKTKPNCFNFMKPFKPNCLEPNRL